VFRKVAGLLGCRLQALEGETPSADWCMIVTLSEAARRYSASRTTLWRLRRDGLLTAPWLLADGRLETHPPGASMTLGEALVKPQFRI
jgi:hypothetical protein